MILLIIGENMTNPKLDLAYANLLLALKQTIEYWTKNKLQEDRLVAFETIKQQYNLFLTTKVNIIDYNIKNLINCVSKVNHPDIVYDEKQQAEVQKILAVFNASTHDIRKEVRQMQTNGVEEYYCPLPSTYNTQQQSNSQSYSHYSQQDRNNGQGGSKSGYYSDYTQQGYTHTNNRDNSQSHRNYRSDTQQQSDYRQGYQQRTTNQQGRYKPEYEYGFDPDTQGAWQEGYGESGMPGFFRTVKDFCDLHFKKIPKTYEEFDSILRLYRQRIERAKQELTRREAAFNQAGAKCTENTKEWNRARLGFNVEEEYRRECVRLNQQVGKARARCQALQAQLDQRYNELQNEINHRITEYNIEYRQNWDLYHEIDRLFQQGNFDLNRPYKNTRKTYTQVHNEAFTYLNSHTTPQNAVAGIQYDVLNADKRYTALESDLAQAKAEWAAANREYSEWYQNPQGKKRDILAQIDAYFSKQEMTLRAKFNKAKEAYEAALGKYNELENILNKFMREYEHLNFDAQSKRR